MSIEFMSDQHMWTREIISFLEKIGIPVRLEVLHHDSFLPGIAIDEGSIIIDLPKLKYPGDLLHEAGHIAVMTAEERLLSKGDLLRTIAKEKLDGYELSAIAWSYAAARYLTMPIELLFHEEGYKNDSEMLIHNYSTGNYLFTPLLQYWGLCTLAKQGEGANNSCYPNMNKWLRD